MPRQLYPSHTGRFGGLNRQLMYARGRLGRFRDKAYGYDLPEMPEGVAGEEWHPEEYKTSPMWDDVEQRLHDILRSPPQYHRDPQSDEDKLERDQYLLANNPAVMIGRERNETLLQAAEGKAGDKEQADAEKSFLKRMGIADGKKKTWLSMVEKNQKAGGKFTVFPEHLVNTAREEYNASLREAYKVSDAAGYGDITESHPTIAQSGMSEALEKKLKEMEETKRKETKRIAGGPFEDYGVDVIFEVEPGPGSEAQSVDRLGKIGGAMDRALARKVVTKEKYDADVSAITAGATGEERLRKAREVLQSNPEIMRILEAEMLTEREQQAPAQMPQSFGGLPEGEALAGEGEAGPGPVMPQSIQGAGPEQEPPPIDVGTPIDVNQPLAQRLPPRDRLGKVPSFVGKRRGGVKEE